jgi:cyclomaltodextrinase
MGTSTSSMRVPDWARDAIWYQVFPERFRNGTRKNDPRLVDITGRQVPGWKISPWGQDWYRQEPWERKLGDFFKSVYYRRFGGDLVGLREKLDYLQGLGVNAIYLNPVFMAPSLHKYDATSLHHIDPTFGPDRDGDLRAIARARETEDPKTWVWTKADRYFVDLVKDIHGRGMRVIIDGVFNHTGREFFAFADLMKKGRASRYRRWYMIKKWKSDGTFEYDGWFGHKQLPELARTEANLAPPVRKYVFDITKRWMDPDGDGDPSDGVDGWRLDVAFCVPHGFWRQWRRHVKKINPEAYLTAEIVGRADDYVRGDEFDAVMNYMWLYPTVGFFTPGPSAISAAACRRRLNELLKAYPREANSVMQNLLDSHDVGRIATMLENPLLPISTFDEYFNATRVHHNPDLVTRKPGAAAWRALRQVLVFQMTYLGAPMLYYGTEAGMWGANDPCDRQPMLWDDVRYEMEATTFRGACKPSSRTVDKSLLAFVKRVTALRHKHELLRRGSIRWLTTGHERLLGFVRHHNGHGQIIVLLNAGDHAAVYKLPAAARDLWNGNKSVPRGNVKVDPRGWRILAL